MRLSADSNSIMQEDVSENSLDNSYRLRVAARPRQKWTLTQEAFDKLLLSLDSDRNSAGAIYSETRGKLTRFFEWRGCPFPEDHADETINRVAKRLVEGEEILNPINTLRMRALRIRENLQRRVENCQKQCKSNCTNNFGHSYFKVERQEQQRQPYRQKGAGTIPVERFDGGGAARGRRPSAPRQTAPLGSRSRRSAA